MTFLIVSTQKMSIDLIWEPSLLNKKGNNLVLYLYFCGQPLKVHWRLTLPLFHSDIFAWPVREGGASWEMKWQTWDSNYEYHCNWLILIIRKEQRKARHYRHVVRAASPGSCNFTFPREPLAHSLGVAEGKGSNKREDGHICRKVGMWHRESMYVPLPVSKTWKEIIG